MDDKGESDSFRNTLSRMLKKAREIEIEKLEQEMCGRCAACLAEGDCDPPAGAVWPPCDGWVPSISETSVRDNNYLLVTRPAGDQSMTEESVEELSSEDGDWCPPPRKVKGKSPLAIKTALLLAAADEKDTTSSPASRRVANKKRTTGITTAQVLPAPSQTRVYPTPRHDLQTSTFMGGGQPESSQTPKEIDPWIARRNSLIELSRKRLPLAPLSVITEPHALSATHHAVNEGEPDGPQRKCQVGNMANRTWMKDPETRYWAFMNGSVVQHSGLVKIVPAELRESDRENIPVNICSLSTNAVEPGLLATVDRENWIQTARENIAETTRESEHIMDRNRQTEEGVNNMVSQIKTMCLTELHPEGVYFPFEARLHPGWNDDGWRPGDGWVPGVGWKPSSGWIPSSGWAPGGGGASGGLSPRSRRTRVYPRSMGPRRSRSHCGQRAPSDKPDWAEGASLDPFGPLGPRGRCGNYTRSSLGPPDPPGPASRAQQ